MNENLNRSLYDILSNKVTDVDSTFFVPNSFSPSPTISDYKSGSIIRWFVRKINEGPPLEVNETDWNLVSTDWWIRVSTDWKISGQRNTTVQNGLTIKGVQEQNESSIVKLQRSISDIRLILTDPLQYWKP
jgi:hypothetical protein